MSDPQNFSDLGGALRALRRRADLSQRELSAVSGVPQATVARIESGRADPRFRTVERLVRAAGGQLVIGLTGEDLPPAPLPPVPYDELRDQGGRRFPAHLDVREVRRLVDWPGAWWAHWYDLPPDRWPLRVPNATYDRCHKRRDRRRWGDQVRREVRFRRVAEELPDESWRFVAELSDGTRVGELRAHERSVDLLTGFEVRGERELVLDGVLVAPGYRRLGIGRRLIAALVAEMNRVGARRVSSLAEFGDVDFLTTCGFCLEARRAAVLTLTPG